MIFISLHLTVDGMVEAVAKGHPDEVISAFHTVSRELLGSRGPWRITYVQGVAPLDVQLDSDMRWSLTAESKDRGV